MLSLFEAAAHHAGEPKAPKPDPKVKPSTPLWLDGKPCLAWLASVRRHVAATTPWLISNSDPIKRARLLCQIRISGHSFRDSKPTPE